MKFLNEVGNIEASTSENRDIECSIWWREAGMPERIVQLSSLTVRFDLMKGFKGDISGSTRVRRRKEAEG